MEFSAKQIAAFIQGEIIGDENATVHTFAKIEEGMEAALELGVPTPATAAALYARQTSRGGADDILRVVSTMRAQFGGHVTKIDEIATH